jgi:hypothetical protein
MASNQPRRQKCQPKLYTESDMRRIQKEALMNLERHHMKLAIGSFALALHRKLGLSADQIGDVLEATGEYSLNALCFTDVQRELKEETGLDLSEYTETI